jgi:hypothetical protein
MKKTDIVTKKDIYNAMLGFFADCDETQEVGRKGDSVISVETLTHFVKSEIALLDKKASYKSTKPTKNQEANTVIKEKILEVLKENGGKMTIKEMWENSEELATITDRSTSKMSALLTQLREKEGKIERTYIKKTAYFSAIQ